MISPQEFLSQVLSYYARSGISPATCGGWEGAHLYPECLGGEEKVLLRKDAHRIYDLLKSEEVEHYCFLSGDVKKTLRALPDELDAELVAYLWFLYKKWVSIHNSQNGLLTVELGVGIHSQTPEERQALAIKGGNRALALGVGIHAPGSQAKGGNRTAELGVGIHSQTTEERRENAREGAKATCSQHWISSDGFVSNPAAVANHNRGIGLDPTDRVLIPDELTWHFERISRPFSRLTSNNLTAAYAVMAKNLRTANLLGLLPG